jgi:hypothetical protein
MASYKPIGVRFTPEAIQKAYNWRTKSFNGKEDHQTLPTEVFIDKDAFCAYLRTQADTDEISVTKTPYVWGDYLKEFSESDQPKVWKFRDFVFACMMQFIGSYVPAQTGAITFLEKERSIPPGFDIAKHSYTIVGSVTPASDIDITIEGDQAAFLIAIIEDLALYMTFNSDTPTPIRFWDVEFYGAYLPLSKLAINVAKLTMLQRLVLLQLALVSYYRSTGQTNRDTSPTIHPNVEYLVRKSLEQIKLPLSYDSTIASSYRYWCEQAPNGVLDREIFYKCLEHVQQNSAWIEKSLKNATSNNAKLEAAAAALPVNTNAISIANTNALFKHTRLTAAGKHSASEIAFDILFEISKGNVHRAESYILATTALYIVEMQKGASKAEGAPPSSWFSSNTRIGTDSFTLMLSAIEQLGYLLHYLHNTTFTKKGSKYVGRYVKSLVDAGLLTGTDAEKFLDTSKRLNAFRGTSKNIPNNADLQNMTDMLGEINRILTTGAAKLKFDTATRAAHESNVASKGVAAFSVSPAASRRSSFASNASSVWNKLRGAVRSRSGSTASTTAGNAENITGIVGEGGGRRKCKNRTKKRRPKSRTSQSRRGR